MYDPLIRLQYTLPTGHMHTFPKTSMLLETGPKATSLAACFRSFGILVLWWFWCVDAWGQCGGGLAKNN